LDVLGTDARPLIFPIGNPEEIGLAAPENRLGVAVRTWVRSLSGMQKEALVVHGASGRAWRLASDEGPYLAGHDVAPCPLSFVTTGMVSSYWNEITALAERLGVRIRDLRLTLDNYYSMEGSALSGTMTGGALSPHLHAEIDAEADEDALRTLVAEAIGAAAVSGLIRGCHTSLFTLTHNGRHVEVDRVSALDRPPLPDPGGRFDEAEGLPDAEEAIRKLATAERMSGVPHGADSSLQESQSRTLHVQGICTAREDGVKEIEQRLFKPIGSTFRYLCDEAPEHGGRGLAPDALTYVSAGIGFCYMTQLGRYAGIAGKDLRAYRIVQDTHFSRGGASGGTGVAGTADAVETHVYLETSEDDGFARQLVDMGEQTCFLHALCRTDLRARLRLSGRRQ
jgi:hypothetical protein